jgi:hypothetical protein
MGSVWEWIGGMIQGLGNVVGSGVERDAALSDIDYQRKTNEERARRMELEKKNILGEATAAANASGVDGESGSIANYLGFMRDEMDRQAKWTKEADERALGNAKTAADWKFAGSFLSFVTMSASTMGQGMENGNNSASLGSGQQQTTYDHIWTEPEKPKATSGQAFGDFYSDTSKGWA